MNIKEQKSTRWSVSQCKKTTASSVTRTRADGTARSAFWRRRAWTKCAEPGLTLHAGDFAENILTEGIDLKHLPVGTVLRVGKTRLQVTQIGKECHNDCEIRRLTGKCVMPTDGIFAIVLTGGTITAGDEIEEEKP